MLGYKVYGVRKGWKGLLGDGDIVDLSNQPYDGWYGGTALRSSRTNPFPSKKNPESRVPQILKNLKRYKIDVLVTIGGDDTNGAAKRLYETEGLTDEKQMVKPVTYSVIKHGLIGLTKYIATYWAKYGVRANTLCPAGVYTNQSEEFIAKISRLIPLNRMANINEYQAAIVFLASKASSYMNGQTLIIDGGRTIL